MHVVVPIWSPVTAEMIEHGSFGLIQQFGAGTAAIALAAASVALWITETRAQAQQAQGMPAQPLPDNTIQDIVAFLHFRVQQAAKSSNVGGDYPLERLLTGNADAGRAYFNGSGKCATCHSPTGDLAGIAKRYAPLYLEERILAPRPRGRTPVTVTTPSGEQVSGKLEHLDEFSVSLRDTAGWYRSWPRDQVKVNVQDPLQDHRDMLTKYTDDDIHNLFAYLETLQ